MFLLGCLEILGEHREKQGKVLTMILKYRRISAKARQLVELHTFCKVFFFRSIKIYLNTVCYCIIGILILLFKFENLGLKIVIY